MKSIITTIIISLFLGCSNIHTISSNEFLKEYKNSKIVHSVISYEYLGEKDGKVYLQKLTKPLIGKGRWNEEIFITNLNELPERTQIEIRNKHKKYR